MKRNWERKLINSQLEHGSLADLLEISEFIDDRAFVTADGYVGVIAKLRPAAFECLDPMEKDLIASAFQKQLRHLDGECRVYQYYLKRSHPAIPARAQADLVVSRVVSERLDFLHDRGAEMFSEDVFLAVINEAKPISRADTASLDREIRSYAHTLTRSVEGMLSGLTGVAGHVLDKEEAFSFLRRLLNFSPALQSRTLAHDFFLPSQIADSNLDVNGLPRMGRYYFRVFTLDKPPGSTYANLLDCLCRLPANMILCSDWKPLAIQRLQRLLYTTKSHLNKTKTRLTNYRIDGKEPAEADKLVHGGMRALIEELEQCERDIELNGVRFGHYCLTAILYDEDPMVLRRLAADVETAMLVRHGAMAEQTDRSAAVSLLATVPGNWRYSFRTSVISDVNYADLSFLFSAYRGQQRNEFLKDEYLTVCETRWSTPSYLNLHVGELGHTTVTGIPGCGKTVLASHLIAQYQKYGPNTVIFDVARSFRHLTSRFNGSYVEVGRPESSARIAPFCLEPTAENINFLFEFVRMLIESDQGPPVSGDHIVKLHQEIERVYRLPKRTLGILAAGLAPDLRIRMSRWIHRRHMDGQQSGQFAYLFDNDVDTLTFAPFQTFDFPDLQQNREAVEALMFYILHQTNNMVERSAQPSLVVMDEAWQFIQHEATGLYIQNAMKAWRKRNGVMMIVTHSLYDLKPAIVGPIVESCATFIHGWNPRINEGDWQRRFKLKACETEIIRELRTPQPGDPNAEAEFLLQGCGVFRLRESPRARWLYSNSVHTNAEKERAMESGVEAGLDLLVGGSKR